jgi:hypothetical protein
MNSAQIKRILACILFFTAVVFISTQQTQARDTSQTTATQRLPEQQTSVERTEVVYVSGNDLVERNTETGELHNTIVPDRARAAVDGEEISALLIQEPADAGKQVAATASQPRPANLPQAGSMLPLLCVLGFLSLIGFILSALPMCMKLMQRR